MYDFYVDYRGRLAWCCMLPGLRGRDREETERDLIADLSEMDLVAADPPELQEVLQGVGVAAQLRRLAPVLLVVILDHGVQLRDGRLRRPEPLQDPCAFLGRGVVVDEMHQDLPGEILDAEEEEALEFLVGIVVEDFDRVRGLPPGELIEGHAVYAAETARQDGVGLVVNHGDGDRQMGIFLEPSLIVPPELLEDLCGRGQVVVPRRKCRHEQVSHALVLIEEFYEILRETMLFDVELQHAADVPVHDFFDLVLLKGAGDFGNTTIAQGRHRVATRRRGILPIFPRFEDIGRPIARQQIVRVARSGGRRRREREDPGKPAEGHNRSHVPHLKYSKRSIPPPPVRLGPIPTQISERG